MRIAIDHVAQVRTFLILARTSSIIVTCSADSLTEDLGRLIVGRREFRHAIYRLPLRPRRSICDARCCGFGCSSSAISRQTIFPSSGNA